MMKPCWLIAVLLLSFSGVSAAQPYLCAEMMTDLDNEPSAVMRARLGTLYETDIEPMQWQRFNTSFYEVATQAQLKESIARLALACSQPVNAERDVAEVMHKAQLASLEHPL
ncbi:hypothetical protein [Ferrimonas pelagia]|uniref:Uncharacterized protein n=1 Tax=Ferrimonas pelagia TaxID=1177826 RepID=A0ABP9FEH4_9GAMM